jgi:hypothetical protein
MKAQARALLEAAAGRELNIMFPMISEPWEFDEAKALVDSQLSWLAERRKLLPNQIRYGAMLEVPALAEVLDILLPKIDFLSIGTNDLTQFLFAADRANPKLAERYDWLSPAILRFLRRIVREAAAHEVPVAVCGEMGGRTLEAMALIGLGINRLSITPCGGRPDQGDDPLARSRPAYACRPRIARSAAGRHARGARQLGRREWRFDRLSRTCGGPPQLARDRLTTTLPSVSHRMVNVIRAGGRPSGVVEFA